MASSLIPNNLPLGARKKRRTSQKTGKKVPLKHRLNSEFVTEEQHIKQVLLSRHTRVEEKIDLSHDELGNLFFTEGGLPNDSEPTSVSNSSALDLQSAISSHSIREPPSNLIESYAQNVDEEPICTKIYEKIEFDGSLLFHPSARNADFSMLERNNNSKRDQGLYEEEIPYLGLSNKNRMYNRLIEENRVDVFDHTGGELKGLTSFFTTNTELSKFGTEKWFEPKSSFVQNHEEEQGFESLPHKQIIIIEIGTITFKHHDLFSEETMLARQIIDMYEIYLNLNKSLSSGKISQKIEILQETIADLGPEKTKSDDWFRIKNELKWLRNKFYIENKARDTNMKEILKIYKKLKSLRQQQQFSSTNLKLIISVDELKSDEVKSQWEQIFRKELEEEYNEALQEYLAIKEDRKKFRRELAADELKKLPELAEKPNKDLIRKRLENKYREAQFDLTGPKVEIYLKTIPKNPVHNNPIEEKRLSEIAATTYLLRVIFNGQLVGTIKNGSMNDNFEVKWNSSIAIKLTNQLPSQIRLDLMEERNRKPKIRISKLYLPVPSAGTKFDDVSWTQIEFSSHRHVQRESGLGSGKFCLVNGNEVFTSGVLNLKYGWKNVAESGYEIESFLSKRFDQENLTKWIDESILDPMNPELDPVHNTQGPPADLLLKQETGEDVDECDEFYFNEDELNFCAEEELNNNQRIKILTERAKNHMKYKDMKLVPQIEREIVVNEGQSEKIIDETFGMDPIDLQRYRGKKYLSKVYSTISNYCKILGKDTGDCNSLLTDHMPTFGSLSSKFFRLLGPNRPLKPTRKMHSSRASCRITDISKFSVTVTVARAFGIPHRMEEPSRRISSISTSQTGFRTINVKPFISVGFKELNTRTSTAEGSNPTWNEQLNIPLNLKKAEEFKGCLVISLFDEFVEDILEDDRNRLSEVYQRISSKWMGELRIPISHVYFNQRIEGTFEVSSPPFLLGYSKSGSRSPQNQSLLGNPMGATGNFLPDFRGPIYLSVLVNLEPNLELSHFATNCLECTETDELQNTINLWMHEYKSEFPTRNFDPFVTLLNGNRVNIMNLFGAISIPFQADTHSVDLLESMIRRFVSLIPVHDTIDQCIQLTGIWLLNDQVFKLMKCSAKDLAVLLVNFYSKLELESWLIIGESQLAINSCFVVLKTSEHEFFIIDPVTGKKYHHTDTYCPLTKISFLVNDQNIYGNIQVEKRVFMTNYDVNISADWRPVFKRNQEISRGFLQDPTFTFKRGYDIRNIQFMIELKLTKKISQWRGQGKTTIWNRSVRDNLRKVLADLERDKVEERDSSEKADKLSSLLSAHKFVGFPLNMNYVNLSGIVDKVKSTGIHLNTDPKVEFALAVYVHPYPQYVLSVWVFLAAVLPK